MSEADKILANVLMGEKKMELEKLIGDLFETGIIVDSKRNRFLVNLVIFCLTVIINFVKTEDVQLPE